MPPKPPKQIRRLARRQAATSASLLKYLRRAQAQIMARISWYAAKKETGVQASLRSELYAGIEAAYSEIGRGITAQIRELLGLTAKDAHEEAVGDAGRLLRYDPARNSRYFGLVRPGNSRNLAAVFTDHMSRLAISRLRWAFVDVFRQATVSGMSASETHRALQERWNELAGAEDYKFTDAAGRRWEDARYLNMLVRTNSARVHRESYIDSLTGMGFTLARVSADSGEENCAVCDAWEGKIIRIAGAGDGYPTYEDSLAAGMWHPNCTHRLEYVDEDEISRDATAKDVLGALGYAEKKPDSAPKP